ncbi:MAG: fused MFS/spermidine synthase [Vicinamibacterales bacterium]
MSSATAAVSMAAAAKRNDGRLKGVVQATAGPGVLVLFSAALLSSAGLTFVLEPLFARMVLPLFGGAPAVWNTCVVFYQLALLAGYLYAHAVTRWLSPRAQVVAQIALMLLALTVLPVRAAVDWMPQAQSAVVPGMFVMLAVSVGLPFFAVATIAPLLQGWFARTSHRHASDPYFLYAASNLGSFVGLIAYPVLVEPNLRVSTQSQWWAAGYVLLIAVVALCGRSVWQARSVSGPATADVRHSAVPGGGALAPVATIRGVAVWQQRLWWVLLSAVPASLMLSVTTYATTDIAAVPLLWVLPLGMYLLTFVVAFARQKYLPEAFTNGALPAFALVTAVVLVTEPRRPIGLVLPLHLVTFLVAALVCHTRLARSRPEVSRLTEFYLWVAVGGAVGGLFNVLAAPLLFVTTAEYPLALALACLARPMPAIGRQAGSSWIRDTALGLLPGIVFAALVFSARFAQLRPTPGSQLLVVCLPMLLCLGFWPRPVRFALGLCGIFLAAQYGAVGEPVLFAERTFYGSREVVARNGMHVLMHGTTNHGAQWVDPGRQYEPTTYYGRTGPIGQVFEQLRTSDSPRDVGVVGLGSAGLAAYVRPGEQWTFYELDPGIDRIARDPRLFTMLTHAGAQASTVLGDARLSLRGSQDRHDILVVDAFSSDAIPVHLLTREAIALYLAHLAPGGVLAFHVSNRYVDLRPVLANLAEADGLVALSRAHAELTDAEAREGLLQATWVVLARAARDVEPLASDIRWRRLRGDAVQAWTDDFSNIWSVFHW